MTFLITYVCVQKFYKEDPLPKSVCSETPKYVYKNPISTRDVRPNTCLKKLDFEIIIQSMFRRRKLLLGNMQIILSSSGTLYLRLALAYNQLHKNACKNKLFSYHLFRWLLIIWSLTGNECVPKCDIRWRLCRLIYPLHGRLEWFKTSVCLNTMALWSSRLSIQIRLWKNSISIKWVKN